MKCSVALEISTDGILFEYMGLTWKAAQFHLRKVENVTITALLILSHVGHCIGQRTSFNYIMHSKHMWIGSSIDYCRNYMF